jgi:hypothetical protein
MAWFKDSLTTYALKAIELEPCWNKMVEGLVLELTNGNRTIELGPAVSGATNQTRAEGCRCINGSSCTKWFRM